MVRILFLLKVVQTHARTLLTGAEARGACLPLYCTERSPGRKTREIGDRACGRRRPSTGTFSFPLPVLRTAGYRFRVGFWPIGCCGGTGPVFARFVGPCAIREPRKRRRWPGGAAGRSDSAARIPSRYDRRRRESGAARLCWLMRDSCCVPVHASRSRCRPLSSKYCTCFA